MTAGLFVQVTVKDFDAWKQVYDGGTQLKKDNGVIAESVHRSLDDPNSVMIYHEFGSEESLQGFLKLMAMPESEEAFKAAGVLTSTSFFGMESPTMIG